MLNLLRPMLGGLKSYVPGVDYRGSGGTTSARYCYTVWMRHLAALTAQGIGVVDAHVVELGPGDTLGVSIAALLSGARYATAVDVVRHASADRNRRVLAELVALFQARAAPPDDAEFPNVRPRAPRRRALDDLLAGAPFAADVDLEWTRCIAQDVARSAAEGTRARCLRYCTPWSSDTIPPGSADLVLSQAVLEYIEHDSADDALAQTFAAMRRWLRPGGVMSHQIDLAGPLGPAWNTHWTVGDKLWAVITGRRPYYENRVPLSEYLELCAQHGFDVLAVEVTPAAGGATRDQVTPRFRKLPEADFAARGVHLIARKC